MVSHEFCSPFLWCSTKSPLISHPWIVFQRIIIIILFRIVERLVFSVKSFSRNFYREIDFTENFFLLFLTITILPILAFLYLCAYFPFLVLIRWWSIHLMRDLKWRGRKMCTDSTFELINRGNWRFDHAEFWDRN